MNKNKRKIELVPHSPIWEKYFQKESQTLSKVLRNNIVEIHHIGSTAIPKILAKPILDILCVVHTMDGIDLFKNEFKKLGLIWKGEHGIPGRLHFVRLGSDGVTHLCHIHIFEKGNSLINDHLDFRDYLNAEDKIAKEYETLKVLLKEKHEENPNLYQIAKNEFIETVLRTLR
jgi:GrpB-like predicted nucleotidyltransferase (UPF0157 family)